MMRDNFLIEPQAKGATELLVFSVIDGAFESFHLPKLGENSPSHEVDTK